MSGSSGAALAVAVALGLGEALGEALGLAVGLAVGVAVGVAVGAAVSSVALGSDTGTHSPLARGTHMCGQPVVGLTLGGGVQPAERPPCANATDANNITPSMARPNINSTFLTALPPLLAFPCPPVKITEARMVTFAAIPCNGGFVRLLIR